MKKDTPLADHYFEVASSMPPKETDPFFYTRLRARMERSVENKGGALYLIGPRLMVGTLSLLLLINSILFLNIKKEQPVQTSTELQIFANSYDLTISTSF